MCVCVLKFEIAKQNNTHNQNQIDIIEEWAGFRSFFKVAPFKNVAIENMDLLRKHNYCYLDVRSIKQMLNNCTRVYHPDKGNVFASAEKFQQCQEWRKWFKSNS